MYLKLEIRNCKDIKPLQPRVKKWIQIFVQQTTLLVKNYLKNEIAYLELGNLDSLGKLSFYFSFKKGKG
jgi:hypothetical protein